MKTFNMNKESRLTQRKKLSIKAALVALGLILSLPLTAMPLSGDGDIGKILERISDRLELSDQQRAEIKLVLESGRATMEPKTLALKASRKQYEELLDNPNTSTADIRKLADQQGQLLADTLVVRAEYRLKVTSLLSEDQRIKLQAYRGARQDMLSMRKKRHKRR